MTKTVRLGGLVAALALAHAPAGAADKTPCPAGLICASDPTTVGAALMKAGYQGLVTKANDGDPTIESAAAGYKFWIDFYGCEDHKTCDSLQFFASFKGDATKTTAVLNEWNRTNRFAKISVRSDHTIDLRYDVSTIGGLNATNFADVIDWWSTMLGSAGKFLTDTPVPEVKKPD